MPRPANPIRQLARLGAAVRLRQLQAEISDIQKAFPELRRLPRAGSMAVSDGHESAASRAKRRWKLSAAQRKAISERMKKTWAERRRKGS
jgi:hypothetical protein